MRFRAAAIVLFVLSVCPVAHAQTPAASLAEASARLKAGERLVVTTRSGDTVRGRLMSVSDAELRLDVRSGEVRLAVPEILRVERPRDSLWNGALIGAGVGMGFGLLAVTAQDECRGPGPCFNNAVGAGIVGGTFAAVGLGVGAAVDALIGKERVVYLGPAAGARRPQLVPMISRDRAGVAVSIRW